MRCAATAGRFKGIAMVEPGVSRHARSKALAAAGVVGVRFNLVSYDPGAAGAGDAAGGCSPG